MQLRVLVLALALSATAHAAASFITGTIKDAQGNPINGTLVMRLPMPAQDPSTQTAIAPLPVTFQLVNGAVAGGAPLYDLATIQPQKLWYSARAYDTAGKLVFYANYFVTGPVFNIGAATPTVVTTSNISFANLSGGGAGTGWGTVVTSSPIQAFVNSVASGASSAPVVIPQTYAGGDTFTNTGNTRIFDFRQQSGVDSLFFRNAREWGVKADAIQVGCVFTSGSTTLACSNANFKSTDVGKTVIAYGAGPVGGSAVSTFTAFYAYVSGGTPKPGFPSGTVNQYVEALNGGTAGAACTTPPAGTIPVTNGVPNSIITLYWSGDGCVTPPTSWQISGFTGASTFSGGTLGQQTLITTIASVTDSTHVVMANAASTSSLPSPNPTSLIIYCTDDTASWNSLAQTFANHQGNAQITFSGGSCISNTIYFENWSGVLTGSGKGNSELGFQKNLGSYFFWATNTPNGVMLENAGGSGMKYENFTLVGNATAPPTGIKLDAFLTGTQSVGAANAIEGVNFGLDRNSDPNLLNYVGYWPIFIGIKADTFQGNADFQRLCYGTGCSFYNVKFPVDKNSDQATGYQWGTVRTFYANVGFCVVGSDQVQEYEGAFNQLDVRLGSCNYSGSGQSAFYGNGVFKNISADGNVKLLDMSGGNGSIEFVHGKWGFGPIKNDGVILNAQAANANGSIILGPYMQIAGAATYSGFPTPVVLANEPAQNVFGSTAQFNSIDPSWFPTTNYPVASAANQYIATKPITYSNITPDGRVNDLHIYSTGTANVDVFNHHYDTDTAGLTQAYGTSNTRKLQSPPTNVSQIAGATPGSTTYQYASQCRLNNFGNSTGSVGTALLPSTNALTTGAATLTPVNANGVSMQWYSLGCDGYYIYLFTGGAYKCLTKSGACVQFTTKTTQGYIVVDDGSYTYGATADREATGVSNVETGMQVSGQDFAGFKAAGTGKGTPQLADFSTRPAADGQFPVYNFASKQYIPGTNVPQNTGVVTSVGGAASTGGYTTVGGSTTTATANNINFVAFTPAANTTIVDGKIYIGATAVGSAYWAIYDSDGTDSVSGTNAPGTLLCGDTTGVTVTATNAFQIVTTGLISTCPIFTSGHKYFWGVVFTGSPSIKFDSPGFSGTSYFANFPGNFPSPLSPATVNENSNIISMFVDLSSVFTFQASNNLSVAGKFSIADKGTCTMASGACSAQTLVATYSAAPTCFATFTGTGTLAGTIKITSTTTTVTPASTTGTDTAQVNWACLGN